jgi:hypothetical protein
LLPLSGDKRISWGCLSLLHYLSTTQETLLLPIWWASYGNTKCYLLKKCLKDQVPSKVQSEFRKFITMKRKREFFLLLMVSGIDGSCQSHPQYGQIISLERIVYSYS